MFTECGERATSVTRQPPFWMTNALKAQPHVVNTVFTHVFGSQAGHGLLLSRRRATEVCEFCLRQEGAGKPGVWCTRSLVKGSKHTSSHHTPKHSGLPSAMVLRLIRGLPGAPGLIATVARESPASLIGVEQRRGSGPHDFAVRFGSTRPVMPSLPSHPALHVRDDAHAPLVSAGYANINHAFLKNGSEEFLARSFSPWPSLGSARKADGHTRQELYENARNRHVEGRSKMSKRQLENALGMR